MSVTRDDFGRNAVFMIPGARWKYAGAQHVEDGVEVIMEAAKNTYRTHGIHGRRMRFAVQIQGSVGQLWWQAKKAAMPSK